MLIIKELYKSYGKFNALNGLNLELNRGEFFGFVGPNGAGKTTTMRIMTGLLRADEGTVSIDGIDILRDVNKIKEKIGYMPDFFGVYDNLKIREYMEFYASIYGIEGNDAKRRINELLDLVALQGLSETYVDVLSRGMKQKLCLARCLLHDPELLILDEPAAGLDPGARIEMKEILSRLHGLGKTIIISSHILPELAQMCSAIGIIQKGSMVIKGTIEEITRRLSSSNPLLVQLEEGQKQAVSVLKANPHVENIAIKGNCISMGFHGNKRQEAELLSAMIQGGSVISSFSRQEGNLESLFVQLTQEEEVLKLEN